MDAASRIVIRPASAADADLLSLVGGATFLESFGYDIPARDLARHVAGPHAPQTYIAALATPGAAAWLAVHAATDSPVGYALVTRPDLPNPTGPEDLELKRIYLFAPWHGRGLADQLLDAATVHARACGAPRLWLGVYGANERARAFYERRGFVAVGTRRFIVGDQTYDDLVYALDLF